MVADYILERVHCYANRQNLVLSNIYRANLYFVQSQQNSFTLKQTINLQKCLILLQTDEPRLDARVHLLEVYRRCAESGADETSLNKKGFYASGMAPSIWKPFQEGSPV